MTDFALIDSKSRAARRGLPTVISFTIAVSVACPMRALAQDAEPGPGADASLDESSASTSQDLGSETGGTDVAEDAAPPEYDPLVLQALEAFKQRKWSRARGLFTRAHELHPTARTLRTIGMCAFNEGDMVGALQHLEAALEDSRKPLTEEQRVHVNELIRRAEDRVGRLRLLLHPSDATLLVDGKPPRALADGQLVLEPGRHELVVSAQGYVRRIEHLRVAARDRATLELRLQRESELPSGAPIAASGAAPGREVSPAPEGGPGAWPWVVLSVGAAGAIVGGVGTALALAEKSTLDENCPDRKCGEADHGRVDDYESLRTIAIVGAAVGVVGLAAGSVMLLSSGEEERAAPVEALIGPGYVGIRGRL